MIAFGAIHDAAINALIVRTRPAAKMLEIALANVTTPRLAEIAPVVRALNALSIAPAIDTRNVIVHDLHDLATYQKPTYERNC